MSTLSVSVLTPRSSVDLSMAREWMDSEDDQELKVCQVHAKSSRYGPEALKL